MSESIVFNVIYVKNTVELLLPLISTMLDSTKCSYRLISNACTLKEESELKKYADSNDRLSYISMNCKTMMKHHSVLIKLLYVDNSKYFAFIDNDMIAETNFAEEMLVCLKTTSAVFTGLPIWLEKNEGILPKGYSLINGLYHHTYQGEKLGVTYCAIYKREAIQEFIQKTGIFFNTYRWHQIPEKYQLVLKKLDLKKDHYDTGKVLNIIWQYYGAKISIIKLDGLIHLGGLSRDFENVVLSVKFKNFLASYLPLLFGMYRTIFRSRYPFSLQANLELIHLEQRKIATKIFFFNRLNNNYKNTILLKKIDSEYKKKLNEVATKIINIQNNFNLNNK